MPAEVEGLLPGMLNRSTHMTAANAVNNEPIRRNRIYTAPPDHHLLIEEGHVRISKGPKENRFRPAIDPLFRSAALAYKERVTGIILTGGLDDGSAGLWAIKNQGGFTIVQDPVEAEVYSMPVNAIRAADPHHVVKLKEMASLLVEKPAVPEHKNGNMTKHIDILKQEVDLSMQRAGDAAATTVLGEASLIACPDCHGVLSEIREGDRTRYRCHTGHAYSAVTLLQELKIKTEESLWNALRGMGELVLLLNKEGNRFSGIDMPDEAAIYFKQAVKTQRQIRIIDAMLKDEVHDRNPGELND
jgi:two-component system chemotaxis response regulator CheB